MNRKCILTLLIGLLSLNLWVPRAGAELRYEVISCGTFGRNASYPSGLNNLGEVACYSYGTPHLFFWDGSLHNIDIPNRLFAIAYDLNDLSEIVGCYYYANRQNHGFIWRDGSLTDLGVPPAGKDCYATAINNQSEVTGYADNHAFRWKDGVLSMLEGLDSNHDSRGRDINDKGQILGVIRGTFPFSYRTFIWKNGTARYLEPLPGCYLCIGNRINNMGDVIGIAFNSRDDGPSGERIVLWKDGVPTDLGISCGNTMDYNYDINDLGEIVGRIRFNYRSLISIPMLYRNETWMNLNDMILPGSGWTVIAPIRINNHSQIAATGVDQQRNYHALLLNPIYITKIDIRPNEEPNVINLKSKGKVAVAVFASEDFRIKDLDYSTVMLAGASSIAHELDDVDGDGTQEMVFRFKTTDLQLLPETTSLTLTGTTFNGTKVQGSDSVRIVGAK
ncbi:MAG: hypothetical protein ABFD54_17430 [Armatimonadota bacterium]|nr:hypothetical protein [bacterium]